MNGIDLIDLMHKSHRRVHVTGTSENGIACNFLPVAYNLLIYFE